MITGLAVRTLINLKKATVRFKTGH